MSQPVPDQPVENDPLLEFSIEPASAAPSPAEPQTTANVEVPAAVPVDPWRDDPIATLRTRVDRLERALDKSAAQVAALNSEVATLVGTIDDIKKRVSRRPANAPLPISTRAPRPRSRLVSAVAGVAIGLALSVWGWTTWTQDSIDAIRLTAAALPQDAPATEPVPPPVTMAVEATPLHSPSLARPAAPRIIPASTPINYVGTLSIDAAPDGQVFIDRQASGRTPLWAANLKAGSHLVWIEREGYRRWTRAVQVSADRVTRLWADLEPLASR